MGSRGEGKGAGQPATGDETKQGEERRDAAVAAVSLGAGMRCAGRRHGQGGQDSRGDWGWCVCVGGGGWGARVTS